MGERKVLNNYIPPDFDPSIIPKFKRDRDRLIEVRMMLPFSLRCNTCGEYMYRGKKFNSKKEDIKGETYMGIKIIRFYIKCSVCSAEITFKTDPKNSDYECESGASRNFELWRDNEAQVEEDQKEREEEEEMDAMKALEHRTLDNKIEMDVLDALDEIRALSYRHEKLDTNRVLQMLDKKHGPSQVAAPSTVESKDVQLSKEDEETLQKIKMRQNQSALPSTSILDKIIQNPVPNTSSAVSSNNKSQPTTNASTMPVVITRKRKVDSVVANTIEPSNKVERREESEKMGAEELKKSEEGESYKPELAPSSTGLSSLLFDYGNESDE